MTSRPYKIPESVLVVIHTDDLQVLLLERADRPGYWQSVTGSKDRPDEPFAETAVREVREETGIRVGVVAAGRQGGDVHAATPSGPSDAVVPLSCLQDWGLQNVYEIYPVWRHRYAPGVTHNTEHVFGLRVPRGVAVRLNPREHLRYEWLPWREAADRCFSPSNAEAVLQLPRFVR
ncbi:MAG TPA: dihydroneopterin triphosphate diphosphatase [Burkholderiaceae bacterium]|nr:dihydroneopterin triphosphate diphosphatase [Burkholderiaceae bacterium]